MPAVLRLDPLQRLIRLSFGNRLAILHVFTSWSGINRPPQALIAIAQPVAFTLIDRGQILDAVGVGSGNAPTPLPPIGEQVSGAMLRAYKAWRYPSVAIVNDQPPYFFGMRCALVLNLGKFAATPSHTTPSPIGISLNASSLEGSITQTTIELVTFRTVKRVTLSSDRSGGLAVDGDFVDYASVRRQMATTITGSIDRRTLGVTLTSTEPEIEPG